MRRRARPSKAAAAAPPPGPSLTDLPPPQHPSPSPSPSRFRRRSPSLLNRRRRRRRSDRGRSPHQLSSTRRPAVRVAALGCEEGRRGGIKGGSKGWHCGDDRKSAWRALVVAAGDAHHKGLGRSEACCAGLDAGREDVEGFLASIPDRPFGVSSSLGLLVTRCCARLADGRAPLRRAAGNCLDGARRAFAPELCYTRRRRRRTP